jgi:hypothetical protein
MIQGIKSVLIGLTLENEDEPSSALGYGLSLAHQAGAHATVQAAAIRLVLTLYHPSEILAAWNVDVVGDLRL